MLGPDDLAITGATLGNPPFRELIEAASAGGFSGVSLWPRETYQRARADGLSDADMRSILDDNGVVAEEVDALLTWVGPEVPSARRRPAESELFEAGDALRARHVNVVLRSDGPMDLNEGAEVFGGICDRAAEHGLKPHIEFMWTPDLDALGALEIVRQADRPNSGLLIDTWHCYRGTTTYDDLRTIPGDRVLGVHVDDAPATPMDDLLDETLHHRLMPGEGEMDLVGFVRILDGIGSQAPFTLEVLSKALVAQYQPNELSQRLGDAVRGVLARARG